MLKTTERARSLRRAMTLPEVLLWREIRALGNPVHLRRQVPIAGLTVDFACLESRFVFEVDGEHHASTHAQDGARDRRLIEEGFAVYRIEAREVLEDPATTAAWIVATVQEKGSPQDPSP